MGLHRHLSGIRIENIYETHKISRVVICTNVALICALESCIPGQTFRHLHYSDYSERFHLQFPGT
jgi:hypothetical protein